MSSLQSSAPAWRLRSLGIVLLLVLSAAVPRLLLLSKGPFHYDTLDLMTEMRSQSLTTHGVMFTVPSFFVMLLAKGARLIVPAVEDLSLLLVSTALLAAAAVGLCYWLFEQIMGRKLALGYALVCAFFPFYFSITTYGRIDYAFGLGLIAATIFFCLRSQWLGCGLSLGLAMACRPESMFMLVGIAVYLACAVWAQETGRAPLARLWMACRRFLLVAAVSVGIWAAVSLLIGQRLWIREIVLKIFLYQFGKKEAADAMVFFGLSLEKIAKSFQILWQAMGIVLVVAVLGLVRVVRQRRFLEGVLFLVSFLATLVLTMNVEGALNEARYLTVPGFFLLYFVAQGLVWVFRRSPLVVAASCIVGAVMLKPIYPTLVDRHQKQYQVDFARYVAEVTEPGSIVITQDEGIFLAYYTSRETLVPPFRCTAGEWEEFFSRLNAILKSGRRVYLAATGLTYDPCLILRNFIEQNLLLQQVGMQLNENWHTDIVTRHLFKEKIFLIIPTPEFAQQLYAS